jgi:hypothetical protein
LENNFLIGVGYLSFPLARQVSGERRQGKQPQQGDNSESHMIYFVTNRPVAA